MNRLKLLREESNLNQSDIAKILHLEIAAISKFETGRVPLKDEYIKILSEYFGVTSDYLLGLSDEREPQNQNLYAFQGGYEQLTEANKKVLDGVLKTLLDSQGENENGR